MSLSPLVFNMVLEVLARAVSQEIKMHPNQKGNKTLFADDIILYIKYTLITTRTNK